MLTNQWGAVRVVSRGTMHHPDKLPGFIIAGMGALTYHIEDDECEVVTLNSLVEGRGVGSALIAAARSVAQENDCKRLWLITTNDNMHALRFYQKQGFMIAALHRNAIAASRRLKPEIPEIGFDGIPIRDEIELEIIFD
jgi:GNAT superfamily N-acetyltransferase